MGVSKPWALDAVDVAARALVDHRGHYANAKHPKGLTGSAFLWAVADEVGTDQRYVDEREGVREEVRIVALSLAAFVATGMGLQKTSDGVNK